MGTPIDRVVFVAVIHTDLESVEHAREVVRREKPAVVAVELDRERYNQLMTPEEHKVPETVHPTGDMAQDLMQQLALLERSLGSLSGSDVGEEMMAAIKEGRALGAKIALVDRPMKETMASMMRIPLDELYKLFNLLPDASQEIQEGGVGALFALLKEEGAIDQLMEQFREEFPNLTKVLIEERDEYVAKALHFILNDVEGTIVAVLGAGHIQGVKDTLKTMLEDNT
jgi:pheromone shutdown protein TraB